MLKCTHVPAGLAQLLGLGQKQLLHGCRCPPTCHPTPLCAGAAPAHLLWSCHVGLRGGAGGGLWGELQGLGGAFIVWWCDGWVGGLYRALWV